MLLVASAVVATFPVQFVKAVSIEDGVDEYKVYTFTDDARSILSANKIDISEKRRGRGCSARKRGGQQYEN